MPGTCRHWEFCFEQDAHGSFGPIGLLEVLEIPCLDGEAPMVSCLGLQKNWEGGRVLQISGPGRLIHRCQRDCPPLLFLLECLWGATCQTKDPRRLGNQQMPNGWLRSRSREGGSEPLENESVFGYKSGGMSELSCVCSISTTLTVAWKKYFFPNSQGKLIYLPIMNSLLSRRNINICQVPYWLESVKIKHLLGQETPFCQKYLKHLCHLTQSHHFVLLLKVLCRSVLPESSLCRHSVSLQDGCSF